MICIYEANETDWHGNGLCILQPSSCTVSEIAGGDFSLTLVHPITEDLRWKELQEERIIKAPVPAYRPLEDDGTVVVLAEQATEQSFRIHSVSVDTANNEVTVEAGTSAIFDRVQDIIRECVNRKGYSGVTIFSSRIQCAECGGWYGSKVWHSTDKYRRVIWQCNAKFRDKTRCKTSHLTEEDIKKAFISVMIQLIVGKDEILAELRTVMETLSGTEELVREQKQLAEQMNADAEAVQELIAENVRKAQDQETYTLRYEALVSRFEEIKAKHAQVSQEITLRGIRRREFGRFIAEVEKLPQVITEFDQTLWGSMVDHLTVHNKDNIVFTMTGGMEIKA